MTDSMLQARARRGKRCAGDAHLALVAAYEESSKARLSYVVRLNNNRVGPLDEASGSYIRSCTIDDIRGAHSTSKSAVRGLAELPTESSALSSTR